MATSQTVEEIEYTEEYFVEKADALKLLVSQKPCPVRNRLIRDLLEEMTSNLEYLQMK
jgi:hypothetical protein